MLLGIPGDNTYANMAEAQRSFWRQTVIPLVNRAARAFGGWLAPAWGGELRLVADLDQVEALALERDALWTRLEKSNFLTRDEKRAAAGYDRRVVRAACHESSGGIQGAVREHGARSPRAGLLAR